VTRLRWFGWCAALGVAAASSASLAAAPDKDKTKAKAVTETRAVRKTRQGSLLKRDKPPPAGVDLRGELERRRDFEVLRHYTRVAELDVIEELARSANDLDLAERVETVRRKEQRRYLEVMQRLREIARRRVPARVP
jgi:hypothetical protein